MEGLPPRKPLYNESDVKIAMNLFRTVPYQKDFIVSKNIVAQFYNAGHILGACSVQLLIKEGKEKKKISFSGDLGQKAPILINDLNPIQKSDFVFIESTYGDRLHPDIHEREKELIRIINETYEKGGKLMIPSFTVERAQELIYLIGQFQEKGLIPKLKVYLDSPMAMKATDVFSKYKEYYNQSALKVLKNKKDIFKFPNLIYTRTTEESKQLNVLNKPCIIIAGNGMCSAGRIKHHIRNGIENYKNTLLFVGFQVQGTLGYWIKKGEKRIKLLGVELEVNAKIESIDGFSAHADYKELIEWLNNFSPKPKKVFLTHGEEEQIRLFSKRISKLGFNNYAPSMREEIEI
jgi:metallo-beta-lactamase family protein